MQLQLQSLWGKKLLISPNYPEVPDAHSLKRLETVSMFEMILPSVLLVILCFEKTFFFFFFFLRKKKRKKLDTLLHSDSLFLVIRSTVWLCSLHIRPKSTGSSPPTVNIDIYFKMQEFFKPLSVLRGIYCTELPSSWVLNVFAGYKGS